MPAAPAPPLRAIIDLLLPSPAETRVLRVALASGPAARTAWQTWRAAEADPWAAIRAERLRIKSVLPLLAANLGALDLAADPQSLAVLRAARVSEHLRGESLRAAACAVLEALRSGGHPCIALRGLALEETAYGGWGTRHSHDLSLLLPPAQVGAAAASLATAGFRPGGAPHGVDGLLLHNPGGVPLRLQDRLFAAAHFEPDAAALWSAARPATVAGVAAQVLAPADQLLHILGETTCSGGRDPLIAVCDAHRLTASLGDQDWSALVDRAVRSRLTLPVLVQLEYLAGELDGAVPPRIRADLRAAAGAGAAADLDALLEAVHGLRHIGRRRMWQISPWRDRLRLLGWSARRIAARRANAARPPR